MNISILNITRLTAIIALVGLTTIAFISTSSAFDWNIKDNDERITGSQLKKLVFGKTVVFTEDGSKEVYKKNKKYIYVDAKGKAYPPINYKFFKDGSRCMYFNNGNRRCDMYVKRQGRLYLINTNGRSFATNIK